MAQLISANAIAWVAILGASLVFCGIWVFVAGARRARQRRAVRRLLELAQMEGRYAGGELTSRLAHDLNNLILVLSLESERLAAGERDEGSTDQHIVTLDEVIAEGRDLAERCRRYDGPAVPAEHVLLVAETRQAAAWLNVSGFARVAVEIPQSLEFTTLFCAAQDVHVLVFSMVAAALPGPDRVPVTLTVSADRDDSARVDDINGNRVCLSVLARHPLRTDDPRVVSIASIVHRLGGDLALPRANQETFRVDVRLPVADYGNPALDSVSGNA